MACVHLYGQAHTPLSFPVLGFIFRVELAATKGPVEPVYTQSRFPLRGDLSLVERDPGACLQSPKKTVGRLYKKRTSQRLTKAFLPVNHSHSERGTSNARILPGQYVLIALGAHNEKRGLVPP